MKPLKLKLLPESSKDGSISFDSVSLLEKSELYESVAVGLRHRVVFCHPTTAADAGVTPMQPVVVQMLNVECNGKKISAEHPQPCFMISTLPRLPQNIAFVSQEGIIQHLLVPCYPKRCLQEHLSKARLGVRTVHRIAPAESISLRPDFYYDSGVSKWTCYGVIMDKMVKETPYSGHPFLFTEASRIFIGDVLQKRYLTVTSIIPTPEPSEYDVFTLGPGGVYEDEIMDELLKHFCQGEDEDESNESTHKDSNNRSFLVGDTDNEKSAQLDILNTEENRIVPADDEDISTSPANTPVAEVCLSVRDSKILDTPESHKSTPEVFVHSISSLSAVKHETDASVADETISTHNESDELTLYYITSETRLVFQSPDPRDDQVADPRDDQTNRAPVKEEKEPYYYNPQVEVLTQKMSTCLTLLQDMGARRCLTVKCGVVVHGGPPFELEMMAKRSAQQLGLDTVTSLCDFTLKQDVAKLYSSAKKKAPAMVLVQAAEIFLCDTIDGEFNTAVPLLLEEMQAVRESRSAVITVCLCHNIEKLSNKIRKALGYDVHNFLPDVTLRETLIRKFLEHKGYSIQSGPSERDSQSSHISVVQASDERSIDIEQNSSKGTLCERPNEDMRCCAEDVAALAEAMDYCSCIEVYEVVYDKLKEGGISGGLPPDFVPHRIFVNDRHIISPTRWRHILGYDSLKDVFQRMVRLYREDPERYPLQGLLLYGPPGCSKTMFVKAFATETNFPYFPVLGSLVIHKNVGETEKHLREVVQRAKAAAPSIVFIDELESLCGDRSGGSPGAPVALLLELISSCAPTPQDPLTSVLFVGATNMPHLIDEGLLQAGYLSHVVHVGLPGCASRCALWGRILSRILWKEDGIDVRLLCQLSKGFSGAEIRGLYNDAGHALNQNHLENNLPGNPTVTQDLLVRAIKAASSRIPASLLAAIDDFTASRTGVIEAS